MSTTVKPVVFDGADGEQDVSFCLLADLAIIGPLVHRLCTWSDRETEAVRRALNTHPVYSAILKQVKKYTCLNTHSLYNFLISTQDNGSVLHNKNIEILRCTIHDITLLSLYNFLTSTQDNGSVLHNKNIEILRCTIHDITLLSLYNFLISTQDNGSVLHNKNIEILRCTIHDITLLSLYNFLISG